MTSFRLNHTAAAVSVSWNAFVGIFLYYVVLTLAAISMEQLPDALMAVAYGAPVALYALALLARGLRALAALPLHFAPAAPHPLPH